MASSIIHLAIAKKVAEAFTIKNQKDYYLGSIAPDISKQIGLDKEKSHFLIHTKNDIPNIPLFIKRYPYFYHNSFDLGYFVHLYTDKLWSEEFLPNIVKNDTVHLLNGKSIKMSQNEITNMIYSDYTSLNIDIIDEYELDLSLFYEEFSPPETRIQEIPTDKLDILLNKMGIIVENSKNKKAYTFNKDIINTFIQNTSKKIIEEIKNVSD
ncbi:MAG: zinc dependent phospholipase C family protein [Bacilli bacterium]|nr:zinc dependent phospholipase C family protein [Bacilli bacterium]